jgi:hypothetical protein
MVREGTGAAARNAFVLITPTAVKRINFQHRDVAGESSVNTRGPNAAPPAWLRLVRTGDVIAA